VIHAGSEVSVGSVPGSVESSPSPSRSAARNAAPRTSSGISAAPGPSVGASAAAAASSSGDAAFSEGLSAPSLATSEPSEGVSALGERTAAGSMVVGLMRSRTGRNRMSAERRMSSSVSSDGVPGMATTMFCPPWLEISASETPEPSTRLRMISMACLTSLSSSAEPSVVRGARMTCVPPSRSSASRGTKLADPPATPPTRMPPRAMRMMRKPSRVRPGRGACAVGRGRVDRSVT
jgi:hypothetical protein